MVNKINDSERDQHDAGRRRPDKPSDSETALNQPAVVPRKEAVRAICGHLLSLDRIKLLVKTKSESGISPLSTIQPKVIPLSSGQA